MDWKSFISGALSDVVWPGRWEGVSNIFYYMNGDGTWSETSVC
jgi:hypothetical protein